MIPTQEDYHKLRREYSNLQSDYYELLHEAEGYREEIKMLREILQDYKDNEGNERC